MAGNYDIGDRPIITGAFADAAETPTAPTAVTVKVLTPAGVVTTYTSPNAAIVLAASTTFTFPAPLDESGTWRVKMTGTAGVQAAAEVELLVRRSAFT